MAAIQDLIKLVTDKALRERLLQEAAKLSKQKKFGLVFEEHIPEWPLGKTGFDRPVYPYLQPVDKIENAPETPLWHALIEGENYYALRLLDYLYRGRVDCIYIDPPYNTGARDWKYNNDYVDSSDVYRHSKWLSMMEKRLKLAKKLLNPKDSVLICTIDEKEYLHLGCLLEEMFPDARIQMVSSVINAKGVARAGEFFRANEYLFIVRLGNCEVQKMQLSDEWLGGIRSTSTKKVRWGGLMRSGTNSERRHSPGCFYPIFLSKDKKHFCGAGIALPMGKNANTIVVPKGQIALFPIHDNGQEGCWQYSRERFLEIQKKGYVRISTQTKKEATLCYIAEGWQKRVESGQIKVKGKREDGSLIFDDEDYIQEYIPCNQWWIPTHDATTHGSGMLANIFNDRRFSFPKSLYAVHDAIRFFVANKPDALIVDFFAGSGTTLHAVNLLNAEDGGKRRCIMVTNNEVSEAEAKEFTTKGLKPGDPEWEKYGIARYVAWPRTLCSIKGENIKGEPLKGNYIGSELPMAEGFKSNVEYFKLGFLAKDEVALGRQFKEILPLLWLKAGAVGKRPIIERVTLPDMLILPENDFAVLIRPTRVTDFIREVCDKKIPTAFIVTDSSDDYADISYSLPKTKTYQLYKDYLNNFKINFEK